MNKSQSIKNIARIGGCASLVVLLSACGSSTDAETPENTTGNNNSVINAEVDDDTGANTSEGTGGLDLESDSSTTTGGTDTGGSDTDTDSGTGTGGTDTDSGTGTGGTDTDSGTGTGGTDTGGTDTDSGTGTGGTDDEHFIFGSVSIDAFDSQTYMHAVFVDFNQSIPEELIKTELEQPRTQDSCEAERADGTLAFGERPDFIVDNSLIEYLSAGEVLTITGPNGTYAELQRTIEDFDDIIFYALPEEYTANNTLPEGLTITIPGDEYPGLSDIAIPNDSPLVLTSNNNRNDFTRDTRLTWVADSNPNSALYLSMSFDALYISCFLVDDGEFTMPDGLKALLNADQQSFFDISRETNNLVRQGNVFLSIFTYSYLASE